MEDSETKSNTASASEAGINKSLYANGWGHKQSYPVKALLNYLSLERLYYSARME